MKMPSFLRSSLSRNSYFLLDNEALNNEENDLLTQDMPINENISENYISDNDSESSFRLFNWKRFHIPRINFAYFKQKRVKRILDIFLCLACLLFVVAVSGGLGYTTLVNHTPVIDKSYRAFGIPNHEAWLNYGALQAAKKRETSFYHGGAGMSNSLLSRHSGKLYLKIE